MSTLESKHNIYSPQELLTPSHFDVDSIPKCVKPSTMTMDLSTSVSLCLPNIFNVMPSLIGDPKYGIDYVQYGSKWCGKSRKKKKEKNFHKSLSIEMTVSNTSPAVSNEVPVVRENISNGSLKLSTNGNIQLSGCRNIHAANVFLNRILNLLRARYFLIEGKMESLYEGDEIVPTKLKINMINTNGVLGHKINLDELYRQMLADSTISKEQISRPNDRVTLLYRTESHTTSIFLFHTGSYMITGGKNHIHIRGAFEFMMGIIEPIRSSILLPDEDVIDCVAMSEEFKHLETM